MSDPDASVRRVRSIKLRNFRGWVGDATSKEPVGLDADIVLISAPNGRGKSSLIEALARVLNGQGFHEDRDNQSLGKSEPPAVQLSTDPRGEISHEDGAWRQRLDAKDALNGEVLQRATTFLQDRLDDQFERSGGEKEKRTLLEFLAPVSKWLEDYRKKLDDLREEWRKRPSEPPTFDVETARRRRDQIAERLVDEISSRVMLDSRPSLTGPPMDQLAALAQAATGRAASAGNFETWRHELEDWLNRGARMTAEEGKEVAKAEAALAAARQKLEEFNREWPALADLAGWTDGNPDLERVLDLVTGLAERPGHWADADTALTALGRLPDRSRRKVPLADEVLKDLGDEFARIDRPRATRYRDSLSGWKTFWDERKREHKELEARVTEAENRPSGLEQQRRSGHALGLLEALRIAQSVLESAQREKEDARRARDLWEKRRPLVEALGHQLELLNHLQERGLEEGVIRQVKESTDAVMRHFVVAGLEDLSGPEKSESLVDVEPGGGRTLQLRFRDNRTADIHMSTGQRAQTALAWLLGTNALLQRWLPHRVLLLDDVSTALDLTNLAAECALLRKFAYTRTASRRRQVIIASHHDQLTHRMFDFLLPPKGFSLREVRLLGWSIENGPESEESNIKYTGAATEETRKRLGDHLATVFEDRAKWKRAG